MTHVSTRTGGTGGVDTEAAVSVSGLSKKYGDLEAVKGIDLEVSPGEVFGFLGPNGAGKPGTGQ